ncbi:MAG: amidase domain-containing protein [Acinetobacter sp.]
MATMYVYNIPTNETVNLRKTASSSGTILVRVGYGKAVQATSYNLTWHSATYSGYSGYIMSKFLTSTDPNGGGSSSGSTRPGQGTVIGGGPLYCRKMPQAGYAYWGQFQEGASIPIYPCSTSGWYETRWPASGSNVGYVMSQYISMSGGSTGGTTTSYTFEPNDAATYALNHSDKSKGKCTKRNTYFPSIDGNDDCADFVSQCLCAGGVPMFNGWFYSFNGIPTNWSGSKWGVTYSGYQKLNGKGWLQTVAYNAIQSGDIIYSYNPNATPTPYTHVTIAVSENVTENGKYGCKICDNTANQHDEFKELTSKNCKCYRVKRTLSGDGNEKRVRLPLDGNGATVL